MSLDDDDDDELYLDDFFNEIDKVVQQHNATKGQVIARGMPELPWSIHTPVHKTCRACRSYRVADAAHLPSIESSGR